MASLKLHIYRGENAGTVSADFRGENFIGSPEDEHRTIFEVDPVPAGAEDRIAMALPAINQRLAGLKGGVEDLQALLAEVGVKADVTILEGLMDMALDGDGPFGLRVGLWDE